MVYLLLYFNGLEKIPAAPEGKAPLNRIESTSTGKHFRLLAGLDEELNRRNGPTLLHRLPGQLQIRFIVDFCHRLVDHFALKIGKARVCIFGRKEIPQLSQRDLAHA